MKGKWEAFDNEIYAKLKALGPCTARTIVRDSDYLISTHSVANALTRLSHEGRVRKAFSRGDVYTWEVVE